MDIQIRRLLPSDIDAIVELSLLAWAPVFVSFRQVLGPVIYGHIYPDWKKSQAAVVETMCRNHEQYPGWVAERAGQVVGFVLYELNLNSKEGEVQLLAVHPDHQRIGIGTLLNMRALQSLQEHGMQVAVVGTGGDPGHAPARAAYEKAGYTALPIVRYYKALQPIDEQE